MKVTSIEYLYILTGYCHIGSQQGRVPMLLRTCRPDTEEGVGGARPNRMKMWSSPGPHTHINKLVAKGQTTKGSWESYESPLWAWEGWHLLHPEIATPIGRAHHKILGWCLSGYYNRLQCIKQLRVSFGIFLVGAKWPSFRSIANLPLCITLLLARHGTCRSRNIYL